MRIARTSVMFLAAWSVSASAVAAGELWVGAEWDFRVPFTAKPERIAGGSPHGDFTLLLQIDATNLPHVFQEAQPDGSDLAITLGDGSTILDHEVVSFDSVAETAELWFRVPSLSDSQNEFFLYYGGNAGVPAPVPGAAWAAEHLAVYHFAEDPLLGVLADYGPGGNDAQAGPNSTWSDGRVPGAIGDGWSFDGVTDWVYTNSISSPDSSFTISAWYTNEHAVDAGMVALQSATGFWDLSFRRTAGSPNAGIGTGNGTMSWLPDLLDSAAHHYVWTLDAVNDTVRFFLDGVEQMVLGRFPPPPAPSEIYTGEFIQARLGIAGPAFFNSLDLTDGIVDEFRVATAVRHPDWILTEYQNQSDPIGFFDYGVPEGQVVAVGDGPGSGPGRISAWPNPFQGVAGLNIDLEGLVGSVRVYDVAGRLIRTLRPQPGAPSMRLRWDGMDDSGAAVGSGIYYVRATGPQVQMGTKVLLVR